MKTVLVTGGAKGIGEQVVRLFAADGWTVLMNYCHSADRAVAIQNELRQKGQDVHLFHADVTDEKQVESMFNQIDGLFHRLDLLVNNAGVALHKQVQDTTQLDYDSVMDVNSRGTFFCCKYATQVFIKQDYGAIINVSSIWGLKGASCESVYAMSKFALVGLTMSLHEELYDSGVCVNCVCPSVVATDMCKNLTEEDVAEFNKINKTRLLFPLDVARKIKEVYLSGDSGKIVEV